jgi:outer membrane immunogenic protein
MNIKKTALFFFTSFLAIEVFAGAMGGIEPGFSGLYGGLGTGVGTLISQSLATYPNPNTTSGIGTNAWENTFSSIQFEGHLGYGKEFPSGVYLGVKGSTYYMPLQSMENIALPENIPIGIIDVSVLSKTFTKPVYNINAILGYEVLPKWLTFVEGGVSFANVNINETLRSRATKIIPPTFSTTLLNVATTDNYKTGYNVGVGTHYKINPNWFISGELIYNYIGKYSTQHTTLFPISAQVNRTYQLLSGLVSFSYLVPNL